MPRFPSAVVAGVFLACLGSPALTGAAVAAPTTLSTASPADDAAPAKDAGSIEGHVASIDYDTGRMTVDVSRGRSKRTYDVMVVPGTNIQGAKTFHTIADLKKGEHVQVLMSQHGSTYTAQSIRLL